MRKTGATRTMPLSCNSAPSIFTRIIIADMNTYKIV